MLFCAFLTRKRITRRRQSIRIMDSRTITEILVMAFLILMSAYFSATETAFSSLNRTRLKTMAEKGSKRAVLACRLSESYDKLLSTILIGNNIVNITASTVGTVLFTKLYAAYGPTVSTVVLTLVVLIFGEISPKSLAKELSSRHVTVNAVAPGVTATDMVAALPEEMIKPIADAIPLRRVGQPEDVANAFVFLASDLASYVTDTRPAEGRASCMPLFVARAGATVHPPRRCPHAPGATGCGRARPTAHGIRTHRRGRRRAWWQAARCNPGARTRA